MTIVELNNLSEKLFFDEMQKCCGSTVWVNNMIRQRPFNSLEDVLHKAQTIWSQTQENDWLEAFNHHPKIGDLKSIEEKFASTKTLAGGEQASVHAASFEILNALAEGNKDYENKFGFIFIVCATGKSASEMLDLLNARITNDRNTELKIAAGEQEKITGLRLNKIIS